MKFISLFSGIGGFDLGFERAGMECVAQVEIDEFCNKVLAKHWPHVPRFKDVRDVGKHNLPAADLIVGGFPCQPHSYAGKRRGKADDRNLWPEYLRVIGEVEPEYVVGENVPGIITTMLDEVLSDLEGAGYAVETLVIPACAFDAPHRRNRVFVVAHSDRLRRHNGRDHWGERSILRDSNGYAAQDQQEREGRECGVGAASPDVAYPNSGGSLQRQLAVITDERGQYAQRDASAVHGDWSEHWLEVATRLCRVDDGLPDRVDRLRALGNAVVPQVAEWLGRHIMEAAQPARAERG